MVYREYRIPSRPSSQPAYSELLFAEMPRGAAAVPRGTAGHPLDRFENPTLRPVGLTAQDVRRIQTSGSVPRRGPLAGLAPVGERPQGVDVIVYDVRVRILLPAAGHGVLVQIAGTAQLVDRIEREIERLPRFAGQVAGPRGFRVKREHRAVGGIDAAPSLLVLILLVTNGHAEFCVSEVAAHEFHQHACVELPFGIYGFSLLEQIARKIQRRPGRTIGGRVVILEELGKERTVGDRARNLMTLDPMP